MKHEDGGVVTPNPEAETGSIRGLRRPLGLPFWLAPGSRVLQVLFGDGEWFPLKVHIVKKQKDGRARQYVLIIASSPGCHWILYGTVAAFVANKGGSIIFATFWGEVVSKGPAVM